VLLCEVKTNGVCEDAQRGRPPCEPLPVPVRYLARATPSQRQAAAPPEVRRWTWHPTSAPRHKAATPEI